MPEIGRTYLPWAYTEQGIAMLSGVLRSDVAVRTSVAIMWAFVEMRRFLASNAPLFEQLREMDMRQRLDQERNERRFEEGEERFNELFGLLEPPEESSQYIFFDGTVFRESFTCKGIVGLSLTVYDGIVCDALSVREGIVPEADAFALLDESWRLTN